MIHEDIVGVLLRMTGCTGQRRMLYLTYVEYAVVFLFFVGAYLSVAHRVHDNSSTTAVNGFSVQLYGILCMIIQSFVLLCLSLRLYQRSDFHDIHRYASNAGIPDDYLLSIRTITLYHLVASNVFAAGAAVYAAAFDSVRAGDPFTFPFADVLPVPTTKMTIYACKYVVYMLPVYIAHFETCFLNTTFMHAAGAVKRHFEIVAELVEEAIAHGDERELKNAIKQHQDVLKHFKNMKTIFAKSILMVISFNAVVIGFTTCLIIEAIKGNIQQIMLGISITSGAASLMTIAIYCSYASDICDLWRHLWVAGGGIFTILVDSGSVIDQIWNDVEHDDILYKFLDSRSCFLDKSFKKLNLIMMSRINVQLEFKIGYIYTVNLELFVRILKFSYTLLNFLLASLRLKNITG